MALLLCGRNSYSTLAFIKIPVEAYNIAPFGQSDDPSSPQYCDGAPFFGEEQCKSMWYNEELLMQHAERELRLRASTPS